ncbi:hypothetical protein [Streptomyces sp. NPDC052036]|uniref:hypothetical protein n=1 Tax=Streptomyces sp. NPDC052036 TaxID=3155171 RepID=UPI003440A95E
MTQGGGTAGGHSIWADLLSWAEGLLALSLMAVVPTIVGASVVVSLVGLTVWATAPLRRRRRNDTDG